MKNSWMKVFAFTFRTTAGGKGYIATTLIVAVLLLTVIPAGMLLFDKISSGTPDDIADSAIGDISAPYAATISRVVTVGLPEEYDHISEGFENVAFEDADSFEAALAACAGDEHAVIAVFEDTVVNVLIPDGSSVDKTLAAMFADALAAACSGQNPETDLAEAALPVMTDTTAAPETMADDGVLMEIIGFIIPYIVVMLMYFMVLIYGQSVANSAIMEKTSKLMDLFLVSVKPSHMMLGKTLATACAGLIQALSWVFSAIGGCALGAAIVKTVNPDTTLAVIGLLNGIGGLAAVFDPAALMTSALIIIAGFMVYCSLASIGGALASKPEDLGSANYLFTIALVISFFVCLFSGENPGNVSDAQWMAYVPFTAVLIMPGRLLTGAAGVGQGLVSFGITAVCTVVICVIAGKAYSAMAFYRGKPISPVKLIQSFVKQSKA